MKPEQIELLVLDVDGILTDGQLYYGPEGELFKVFYAHDGMGLKQWQAAGFKVAIISARKSAIVQKRAEDLKISHVFQGIKDKKACLMTLLSLLQLKPEQVCYMGDDIVDQAVMSSVGYAVTVPNAHASIKAISHFQTEHSGGKGAVREVCDMLLSAKQKRPITELTTGGHE